MTLFVPSASNAFEWWTSNNTGRPGTSQGTSLTPGNNTYPAYTQLLSAVAQDVCSVIISFNSNGTAAAARDTIVNIGVDPAGGSSYTTVISHLLASCAGAGTIGFVNYQFPLWIRAGSSIAATASINNATVGTLRCWIQVAGRPTNPEAIKCGTYVDTFGATTATSSGTAVTPGTTSEGTWTSLGTTTRSLWWWQCGFGINNSAMAARTYGMDLGIGTTTSNARTVIDTLVGTDATERVWTGVPTTQQCEFDTPSGQTVYGRLQCSGVADSGISMAAYGLGG